MWNLVRKLLIGTPLPSWRAVHERLPKILALPILASDALSSVAYSGEELLIVLVLAGTIAIHSPSFMWLSIAIVTLLAIVATSYRQTIHAYPSGGGAYTVAKENLGTGYGLVAGASLVVGYTLTVAVSIAAGVSALISAFPEFVEYRVHLGIVGIAVITLGNLRGVRESGLLFAMPTYVFIASMITLVVVGIYRLETGGLFVPSSQMHPPAVQGLTLFLILRAFSGGCAIMTGTEAISNAVPNFRPPESRNAATTLTTMAVILSIMFIGTNWVAWKTGVIPVHDQTVISQIARAVFGTTKFYYVLQIATVAILILAANTAYAGFPWLASVMARDRYMPRQLYNVGDRLVFSNAILLLSLMAAALIVLFRGDTHKLIPLYAVGVFLSFTLSQAGMVKHAARERHDGWRRGAVISLIGAVVTGGVTLVVGVTRFMGGAWIVIVLIPLIVYLLVKMHDHYVSLGDQLRLTDDDSFVPMKNTVIVLTPSLHRGVLPALEYAQTMSGDVRAIHIETDPIDTRLMIERWDRWGGGIPLVILESPYRSLLAPLMEYLEEVKVERNNHRVTVVVPEFVPAKWWHKILHNQSGFLLKIALLFRRDIITANVRYYLER
ncbi:MAG: APC family permease [Armatimonadetes bacterium]|nr:APC family permease [Armatimonadota bacterium]